MPARRVNEIVLRKRRVSADAALRFARSFDTTPQFWLGLQTDRDVEVASDALGDQRDREVRTPAGALEHGGAASVSEIARRSLSWRERR